MVLYQSVFRQGGMLKRATRIVRTAVVLLCVSLFLSGCRSELFPRELRVSPDVVSDVSGIGKTLGRISTQETWDGTTTITETLMVDVGGSGTKEALAEAVELLQRRQWVVDDQRIPEWVEMGSAKWENVRLTLHGMEFFESSGKSDPLLEGLIKDARAQAGSRTLLALGLYLSDE